jgi:hypothetical protein
VDGYTWINLEIKFNQSDIRRYLRALKRVERAVDREKRELPYRGAVDYVNLLTKNIMSQKYLAGAAPYNPKYEKWKSQHFMMRGFWIMRGEIIRSLTVYRDRHPQRWIGGLPKNAGMVPGSSWFMPPGSGKPKSINMYAYVNEYGGVYAGYNHPARPIFRPTKVEYQRDGFPKRIKESKNIIGRSWR